MQKFDYESETQGPSSTVLWTRCMDCDKYMGTKNGNGIAGMSHGLCDNCFSKRMEEMRS